MGLKNLVRIVEMKKIIFYRYRSSRLPSKILQPINGSTLEFENILGLHIYLSIGKFL